MLERGLIPDDPESVLQLATDLAAEVFGRRLVASYAIGSLAHGGFSPAVSDVDLAIVVDDPLTDLDAASAENITSRVRARGGLAERLSLFWSSPRALTAGDEGGRLPALDRLDLARHGRLLRGSFDLTTIRLPPTWALIVEATQFAIEKLSTPAVTDELHDPCALVAGGARHLTKRILFPVRFTFTALTHEMGTNESAAAWYHDGGYPAYELVGRAARWRTEPIDIAEAERLVGGGIIAVYDFFLARHIELMDQFRERGLAGDLRSWRERLNAQ